MGNKATFRHFAAIILAASTAVAGCGSAANSNTQSAGANSTSTSTPKMSIDATPSDASADDRSSAQTTCGLAKAPTLKGFSLGQPLSEVASRVKNFEAAYKDEKAGNLYKKEVNFVVLTYGQIANKYGESEGFEDVSLIWHFLDDKLVGLVVKYMDDGSDDIDKFVAKMAKANELPEKGWKIERAEDSATLTCSGFEAIVSTHPQNGPSIMLFDTAAEQEKQKRMK